MILIAGPTGSGKSALALELAVRFSGTIINADALQLYRDLRILTARPDAAALAAAPHRLYGVLDASERGTVAQWRRLAIAEIAAAQIAGGLPIVVGGSGLYLRTLTGGLAVIPAIPPHIRAEAADLYEALGGAGFRERLAKLDPAAAARLPEGDRQRLKRAFEVVRATGVPIGAWQVRGSGEGLRGRVGTILLMPPRTQLHETVAARFRGMIDAGALAEAAALMAQRLDPDLPAMKAVGLRELLRHLRGELTLEAAIVAATTATRRYAKRQMTWFRHQMTPDLLAEEQYSESLLRCSRHFIDQFLLTHRP